MGNFIKQFFDIKFWKFILVGILNTVVGMGLQFLFFNLCGWNEWVSSLIGYILGSILSYFLNKYFTFKNKDKGWKPIVKFALNIAICYGLAYGIAIPLISMLCTANSWTMFGWSVEKFAGNFSMIVGACLFPGNGQPALAGRLHSTTSDSVSSLSKKKRKKTISNPTH